jgi:hypothetical protein
VSDPKVIVMTRQGCPSCEVAEADVARICDSLGVGWAAADVDADPVLAAEYGDRVPVILVDGVEHGHWTVEEESLRRALAVSNP